VASGVSDAAPSFIVRIAQWVFLSSALVLIAALPFSNALIEITTPLMVLAFLCLEGMRPGHLRPAFVWLVGAWLAAGFVSVVLSVEPDRSLHAFLRKTVQYALLALAAARLGENERWLKRVLAVLIWGGVLISIDATVQHFVGHDLLRFREPHGDRLTGPFNSPNNLGSYFVFVIIAQLWMMLRGTSRRTTVALVLAIMLEAWVLLETDARGVWLVLMIGVAVLLVVMRRARLLWVLVVMGGWGLWHWLGSNSIDGLRHLDPGRHEGWTVAWRMFLDYPVSGLGMGRFMAHYMEYIPSLYGPWPRPQYAHNCYLQLLAEGGIIGIASFLSLVGFVFRMSLRRLARAFDPDNARHHASAALIAALTACLINFGFDTGLYSLPIATLFWFFLGLAAGASRHQTEAA